MSQHEPATRGGSKTSPSQAAAWVVGFGFHGSYLTCAGADFCLGMQIAFWLAQSSAWRYFASTIASQEVQLTAKQCLSICLGSLAEHIDVRGIVASASEQSQERFAKQLACKMANAIAELEHFCAGICTG